MVESESPKLLELLEDGVVLSLVTGLVGCGSGYDGSDVRVRWHMWSLAPEWRTSARGVTGRGHKRCKALNIIPM